MPQVHSSPQHARRRAALWIASTVAAAWCLKLAADRAGDGGAREQPALVTIAAASSLRPGLDEIGRAAEARGGPPLFVQAGASAILRAQLLEGAAFDVFIPADAAMLDEPAVASRLVPGSVRIIGRGRLMLFTHADHDALRTLQDLTTTAGPVAAPNPDRAPFGRATIEALRACGAYDAVRDRLVFTDDAESALRSVVQGAVAYAFAHDPGALPATVRAVPVDAALYRRITYAGALVARPQAGDSAAAALAFLVEAPEAQRIWRTRGVEPAPPPESR